MQGAARVVRGELERSGGGGIEPAIGAKGAERERGTAQEQRVRAQRERQQEREHQRSRDGPERGR